MDETEQIADIKTRVSHTQKWLETLLVTGLFLAFSVWHRPADPFFLNGNFPWPAIAPLLLGLRYGFFMALVSALLVIAGLGFYLRQSVNGPESFPYVWTIGVLGISLLAGEFRDYWERQRQKLEASNDYRGARLEEFTRNYYLMKVSHDRLEQQLAGSSSSLREALRRFYSQVGNIHPAGLNSQSASLMLQLLVRYGQLQSAAIYALHHDQLEERPLASVGRFRDLNPHDPLLQHALAERTLVSVQTEFRQRIEELDTNLLAVIPLIDSEDRFIAVCAIEAMPFFSFEPRTLRLLAILAGHMADVTLDQTVAKAGSPAWRSFQRHLARTGRDAERFDLPAALMLLPLSNTATSQTVIDHVQSMCRGLDVVVEHHAYEVKHLLVLMPLTDELGLAGYLHRLNDSLREQLGLKTTDLATPSTLQIRSLDQAEEWIQSQLFDQPVGLKHEQ